MNETRRWRHRAEQAGLVALLLLVLVGAFYIQATVAREAVETVALIAMIGVVQWRPPRAAPDSEADPITQEINAIVTDAWRDEALTMDGGQ